MFNERLKIFPGAGRGIPGNRTRKCLAPDFLAIGNCCVAPSGWSLSARSVSLQKTPFSANLIPNELQDISFVWRGNQDRSVTLWTESKDDFSATHQTDAIMEEDLARPPTTHHMMRLTKQILSGHQQQLTRTLREQIASPVHLNAIRALAPRKTARRATRKYPLAHRIC